MDKSFDLIFFNEGDSQGQPGDSGWMRGSNPTFNYDNKINSLLLMGVVLVL